MLNAPTPGGGPSPGIPGGAQGPPPPGPGLPPGGPPPPAIPSAVPQAPPSPPFHDLPSRLPHGIQLLDAGTRSLKKALGSVEFVSKPHYRAALLALTQDAENLISVMTREYVGKGPTGTSKPTEDDTSMDDEGGE